MKKIKEETIHTLARIGRKYRLLRYPILAVLVIFVFIYNVLLYGFIHFKMRERLARGLAMAMTVVLVFTSVDLTVLAMTGDPMQPASYEAVEGETPDPVKMPEGEEPENPEENAAPGESANPEASAAPEESANLEESAAPGESANPEASAAPEESAKPEESAAPGESADPEMSAAPETTAEPEAAPAPEMTVSDGNAQGVPETVTALQQRINALPTVEEFIGMADGTYVEDSLWNEAQMNIYYEMQDIADIYDSLTEEEQAMVDVTKLMELFDYINSAVMPLVDGNYEPITISKESLNGNAIWGATEDKSKVAMDDSAHFYVESHNRDGGLPTNGKITMPQTKVQYQLATGDDSNEAYDGNDCIRLTADHKNQTMDLETIGVYQNIYVFATAGGPGEGNYAKFKVTLHYTNNTEDSATYALYDWFDLTSVDNVEKYYNVKRMNIGQYELDGSTGTDKGPVIHSAAIKVNSSKLLKSISFEMLAKVEKGVENSNVNDLYCCIFAVTGATPAGVPDKPEATQATKDVDDNTGAFTANWNQVTGATGYHLDVATDRQFKNMVANYNNENVGNVTQYVVSGNDIKNDTVYYYRVRAYNAHGQSLSSNRVATDLPKWIKNALEEKDYNSVSYDAETNTVTFNKDVTLKDIIQIPGEDSTVIDLNSNTVTAPTGKSAISANEKNTELTIKGTTSGEKKGSIIGSTGSDGNGVAAIDFGNAGENSTITVSGSEIRGGDGVGSTDGTTTGDAGNGGAGIIAGSDSNVKVETNATVTGGNGGSTSNGNGGNGGAGISGGKVSVAQNGNVNGGNGGSSANGTGGNGGTGVTGSSAISSSGKVTGGNGGDSTHGTGGNGGSGVNSSNTVYNSGNVSGGNGGNGTEAGGAAGALNSGSGNVTGSGGTAAAGKPGKKPQKGILSMKGYTYGDNVSVPTITGMQGNPQITYYYNLTDSNTDGTKWDGITPITLNAGDYYLYAVLDETDEYSGYTTAAVKFTVGRRTITDDKVNIKFDETGNIKVTVEDSMPDGYKTLTEEIDYTVEKTETASDETFVIKGTGNYQFEITKKVSKPEWKENDKKKTATTVVVEPGAEKIAPKMDEVSETDTKNLLTKIVKDSTVKQKLESADADLNYNALLYLEVKQADSLLTVEEKKLIADGISAAKELPAQTVAGKYIDLSLYMTYTVSDNTRVLESGTEKITDTSDEKLGAGKGYKQVIRLTIPEELRVNDNNIRRSYYMLRVHDDGSGVSQVEILNTTQEGYVLTFETDKFSTYVIAYADQKKNESKKDENQNGGNSQNQDDSQNEVQSSTGQASGNTQIPKTGDDSNILLWMLLLFGSACGMAGLSAVYCKRKKSME